jgi:hypothetical protein
MRALIIKAYDLNYVVDENARFIVEEAYEPLMKDVVKLRPVISLTSACSIFNVTTFPQ